MTGNLMNRIKVTLRTGGNTGFHHVHTETLKLQRNAQLFFLRHRSTGALLPVAKRRVKNNETVCHCAFPYECCYVRSSLPETDIVC